MTNRHIARAFSGHRFEETFTRLTPRTVWNLVGVARIEGRDAIIDACRSTVDENADVETRWLRFVTAGSDTVVAVDAVGRYAGPRGVSTVSSCDIFEFDGDMITTITSYAVELPSGPGEDG